MCISVIHVCIFSMLTAGQPLHAELSIVHPEQNVAALETIGRNGLPHVMLFTTRHIRAGQELLLSYTEGYWRYHTSELNRLQALAVHLALSEPVCGSMCEMCFATALPRLLDPGFAAR